MIGDAGTAGVADHPLATGGRAIAAL